MPDLSFAIDGVEIERFAAVPTLLFKLRVENRGPRIGIQNVLLSCQIRIEATRRRYSAEEQERLQELFGEAHRFEAGLRGMLWTHTTAQVPAFEDERTVEMPVPGSFDLDIAAVKYFYGLEGTEVPLTFLFSGTVFYRDEDGYLQVDPIPWSKEASFRLPVSLWREAIDAHYPNSAWLRLDRGAFDGLCQFRRRNGFTSWEQALGALLRVASKEGVS